MARTSLTPLVVIFACTGCLDDPSNYVATPRIPPVIDMAEADPSLMEVNVYAAGTPTIPFNVPYRSDDRGDNLRVRLFRDLGPDDVGAPATQPLVADSRSEPADPRPFFEQDDREFVWTWQTEELRGCHSLTIIMTHAVRDDDLPVDESQAARATWWFVFGSPGEVDVASCGPER